MIINNYRRQILINYKYIAITEMKTCLLKMVKKKPDILRTLRILRTSDRTCMINLLYFKETIINFFNKLILSKAFILV